MKEKESSTVAAPPSPAGVSRRAVLVAGAGIAVSPWIGGCGSSTQETSTQPRPPKWDADPNAVAVTLNVNGESHVLQLDPRVTLLDALRDDLGLTGTKKGCDHGQCGACTVLIDGRRVNSCLTLAIAAQGPAITTIEGVAQGDQLHPIQAAFIQHDAFQCGYCTPGQICSAIGLLNEAQAHSDDDIREQMSGNICRCGAYPNIVSALRHVMNKT
jgi:xanthine dehydrogenase YagT iron-sulfur-binding subunit